jgi:methylenetetrahydrofolate dehydrogenase (NADP+) / methenyltetrahydrofolate cyclohydrolase / formyltetrahydrofolate synthetase
MAVCQLMYQASDVTWSDVARTKVAAYTAAGFGQLPVCIAKTQYSLSTDPALKGE